MSGSAAGASGGRCPVCGDGTLADIDFGGGENVQDTESRQVDAARRGVERVVGAGGDRAWHRPRHAPPAAEPG